MQQLSSKATVLFKGNGSLPRQRFSSKATVLFQDYYSFPIQWFAKDIVHKLMATATVLSQGDGKQFSPRQWQRFSCRWTMVEGIDFQLLMWAAEAMDGYWGDGDDTQGLASVLC
jgi:hypothetical protein